MRSRRCPRRTSTTGVSGYEAGSLTVWGTARANSARHLRGLPRIAEHLRRIRTVTLYYTVAQSFGIAPSESPFTGHDREPRLSFRPPAPDEWAAAFLPVGRGGLAGLPARTADPSTPRALHHGAIRTRVRRVVRPGNELPTRMGPRGPRHVRRPSSRREVRGCASGTCSRTSAPRRGRHELVSKPRPVPLQGLDLVVSPLQRTRRDPGIVLR